MVGVKKGKMTGRTDLRGRDCGWGYWGLDYSTGKLDKGIGNSVW